MRSARDRAGHHGRDRPRSRARHGGPRPAGVPRGSAFAPSPSPTPPNLDILLQLLDASGEPLGTNNPATSLSASLEANLPAGTYYLEVRQSDLASAAGGVFNYRLVVTVR